jgi:hypothetical protein
VSDEECVLLDVVRDKGRDLLKKVINEHFPFEKLLASQHGPFAWIRYLVI